METSEPSVVLCNSSSIKIKHKFIRVTMGMSAALVLLEKSILTPQVRAHGFQKE
jgi:hypothetical protein